MMRLALYLSLAAAVFAGCGSQPSESSADRPPNFIVIFADDLGYGDLGAYGDPTIATPNLDRMAAEGQKWTNFYVGACVCTPSRAALLTGRLPIRNGMLHDRIRVLFPESYGGLQQSEVTIAEVLKQKDYATAAVGKWHLGHLPEFLPMQQGFDSYFGIPYSNDMDRVPTSPRGRAAFRDPKSEYWNVPLMRNEEILERPAQQETITKRYTEEALKFIRKSKDKPFFLYFAQTMVHVPLFASDKFLRKSRRGLYGDTIEEIDWSVGQILDTLRELDLDERTMVVFTSDNGPWLSFDQHGGSAGMLREGKGSTWEGGMREPGIFWWPGKIKPGTIHDMGATMDFLPTIAKFAGVKAPTDRILDGYDLSGVLTKHEKSPRNEVIYYRGTSVWAARMGPWKAHFKTKSGYRRDAILEHDPPLLYNLNHDPREKFDLAAENGRVIEDIKTMVADHVNSVKPVENQIARINR